MKTIVPTLKQEAVAVAARLEAGEAEADAVIEKYLETLIVPGVPKSSSDAMFWARVPQHNRLLALRQIMESPYDLGSGPGKLPKKA